MEIQLVANAEGEALLISLDECIDIRVAGEMRELFRDALATGNGFILNGSATMRADTAALQLLLALFAKAKTNGVGLAWQVPSPALRDAARQLGLDSALNLL